MKLNNILSGLPVATVILHDTAPSNAPDVRASGPARERARRNRDLTQCRPETSLTGSRRPSHPGRPHPIGIAHCPGRHHDLQGRGTHPDGGRFVQPLASCCDRRPGYLHEQRYRQPNPSPGAGACMSIRQGITFTVTQRSQRSILWQGCNGLSATHEHPCPAERLWRPRPCCPIPVFMPERRTRLSCPRDHNGFRTRAWIIAMAGSVANNPGRPSVA
jgi:hypothetical protein